MRRTGGRDRSGGTRLRGNEEESEEVRGKGYEAETLSILSVVFVKDEKKRVRNDL